jgi:hypothetical protein
VYIEKCTEFEQKLAYHTAPTLLGIKCANLISLSKTEFDLPGNAERFNKRTASRGLKLKILCSCKNRVLILLYSEKLLAAQLADQKSQAILKEYGYGECASIGQALDRLAGRILDSDGFPHEIGVFLGYPAEDVVGFIENGGMNFSLCGYWKVYGDPEKARRTFNNYDKCRKFLCDKLNQGFDIYQALRIS